VCWGLGFAAADALGNTPHTSVYLVATPATKFHQECDIKNSSYARCLKRSGVKWQCSSLGMPLGLTHTATCKAPARWQHEQTEVHYRTFSNEASGMFERSCRINSQLDKGGLLCRCMILCFTWHQGGFVRDCAAQRSQHWRFASRRGCA